MAVSAASWENQMTYIFTVEDEFADNIEIEIQSNGGSRYIDAILILPLSNGYNYPMDIVHQFMSEVEVTKQVIKDVD